MPGGAVAPGFARSLWILARPRLAPYVLCLPVVGFAWAHWDRALTGRGGWALLLVLGAWWALHAGTLWLNAALDRDEGEVLYGRATPVPPGIVPAGYAGLATAVLLAFLANPLSGLAGAICAVLAALYSHPRTRWKGHPLGGPVVNGLGYGLLSPLAGWAAVDVPANPRTLIVWVLSALAVLACYFAAQAFQRSEDAARGYRTLVVTHGPAGALRAARICLLLGFSGGVLLAALGWLPRACLAGGPLWWWIDRWLAAWTSQPGGGSEAWARGLATRLLAAVALCLALVFGEYARESLRDEPVAGLGTAAGHPADRPRLPPRQLLVWETVTGQPTIPPLP